MTKSPLLTKKKKVNSNLCLPRVPLPDFSPLEESDKKLSFKGSSSGKKNLYLSPRTTSAKKRKGLEGFIAENTKHVKKQLNFGEEKSIISEEQSNKEVSPTKTPLTPVFVEFFSPRNSIEECFFSGLKVYDDCFKEIKLLDSGDFGEVYLAEELSTGNLVAVKKSIRGGS